MGEVYVPAGMDEEYIRHLIDIAGDPYLVTTTHGPNGVVFMAPDYVIDAFNERLVSGQSAPEWGNGAPVQPAPAQLSQTADQTPEEETAPPKRRGRPKGSKNQTKISDTEE